MVFFLKNPKTKGGKMRKKAIKKRWVALGAFFSLLMVCGVVFAQEMVKSSYSPVVIKEPFAKTMARMEAAKPAVMERQMDLLCCFSL